MAGRDFFGFCTSLKPVELRAIGGLSRVRHLEAGETIYREGDPAETLFIINRGVVEMLAEGTARARTGTYLSRGDIFGDVEVLTGLPRHHSVRTREAVSVQCFERENFAELVRSVPAFFQYLSERLASRLLQARDAALSQSHCLDLSGSLGNFDLVTIFQTIAHSAQTGTLWFLAEGGESMGVFQFDAGRLCGGAFQHLRGEEAFWQLFLTEKLRGTFSFSSAPAETAESERPGAFMRELDDLLIRALQSRDELQVLRKEMSDGAARLLRQKLEVATEEVAPEIRTTAGKIWRLASGGRLQLEQIYARLDVCELQIYRATQELVRTGQLELVQSASSCQVA